MARKQCPNCSAFTTHLKVRSLATFLGVTGFIVTGLFQYPPAGVFLLSSAVLLPLVSWATNGTRECSTCWYTWSGRTRPAVPGHAAAIELRQALLRDLEAQVRGSGR
jgi:hypothetical protein